MLIDDFLPEYDFNEVHDIQIRAAPTDVFRAVKQTNFGESTIIRWLLRLRGMSGENVTVDRIGREPFATLGEEANEELILGLAGKFWRPTGNLRKVDPATFREFNERGLAKAVWDFSLEKTVEGTRLTTETRIKCTDDDSRRWFGWYWTVVGPFSGLIRAEMLKLIKSKAESVA